MTCVALRLGLGCGQTSAACRRATLRTRRGIVTPPLAIVPYAAEHVDRVRLERADAHRRDRHACLR
jgi:hypothetical protein